MRYTIIASIITLLAVFGTWYVTQDSAPTANKTTSGDAGINLN